MSNKTLLAILTFIPIILISVSGHAQDKEKEEDHHEHKNEISIAAGIAPLPAEDEVAAVFHLHYIRGIGKNNKFGLGTSVETIIDEHKHYTLSVIFHYRVYKGFILAYAPGLLIKKENSRNEFQFAQHIEMAYEFELGKFHLGPVVDIGIDLNEVHYMGGIHFGIDF